MSLPVWPELFFIRHGETRWNAEKRYQGRRDIPLNETGRAQADRNGIVLRDVLKRLGRDPAALDWHASPLGRTRETAARVREAFAGPLPDVKLDDRLVEVSFGALEGVLMHELPPGAMVAPGSRDESFWDFRPPDGENYRDLEARLNAFAETLRGPSVMVGHGGVARALRVMIDRAPIVEVVNWTPPQDVVMHFAPGRPMQMLRG